MISRWAQARVLGGALILGYHRISATGDDVYGICVSPENFASQMESLRRHAQPISLSRLVQNLQEGSLPPNSVAVTFDDGYVDNLYSAKPILEKYEIPATVFICTGYAGREFWWDELHRLVISSRADPRTLRLKLGETQFKWEPPYRSSEAEDPEVRRQFRRSLYHFLLSLDVADQTRAMDAIRIWSGFSSDGTYAPRAMSKDEVLQFANGGLIEVGAHTRHHPMLHQLSLERQKDEIGTSKRELEALLGNPVRGFAYPNGRANTEAKWIVREAGFEYACTSLNDLVRPGSDMYELTRFWQKDVDGESFVKGLNRWMRLVIH
jgi:peptidoglycan/xylan/chitin deacetylase (PgdA/CDA1 family)